MWGKVYHKHLMKFLKCDENHIYNEDIRVIWNLSENVSNIFYVDDTFYHYRNSPESICHKLSLQELRIDDIELFNYIAQSRYLCLSLQKCVAKMFVNTYQELMKLLINENKYDVVNKILLKYDSTYYLNKYLNANNTVDFVYHHILYNDLMNYPLYIYGYEKNSLILIKILNNFKIPIDKIVTTYGNESENIVSI